MILVSSCLVGKNCKYNGSNNYNKDVESFLIGKKYIDCCPEQLGGLETPRPKVEIRINKAVNEYNQDVTKEFIIGSELTLKYAKENHVELAILKERSPSCGVNKIYNGNFENILIEGMGISAKLLSENGIKVISEEELGQ
jgi:uncharacterized protein YbbK (DUF523 family)